MVASPHTVRNKLIPLILALTLVMSLLTILSDLPAHAATPGVIETSGPLESIATSPDLNCDVRYVGDQAPEFYAGIACGTFVAVGGTLYGPESVPAGGGASPRTAFTAVSQEGPIGSGTAVDPWLVTTVVDLGDSGVRLTQTDTYVAGQQSYLTRVRLSNDSDKGVSATIYRAGDCYVADSDYGYGDASEGTVACVAESGRVAKWIPVTGGSAYLHGWYYEVWEAIGTREIFPDTTRADEYVDNGAGLSWRIPVAPGQDGEVAHLTAFSEDSTAAGDTDGDGLLDEWETNGLDVDGDGVPEIDLPGMGATPDHKDLFVEVDWMAQPRSCVLWWCWGGLDFAPQQDAIEDVVASFAAAPVPNPSGTTGIRLHVDAGPEHVMNPDDGQVWGDSSGANALGHQQSLGTSGANGYDWSEFNTLKAANFESARADVFHYAIFADTYAGSGSSGIAQVSDAAWEGDSFLVTDGAWGAGGFSLREESGTFMHEFGHILGLRHGGVDHVNHKPNYQSIMSYFWQMGRRPLDFSRRALPTLDELALVEGAGLPGARGAYSWFCPGSAQRQTSTVVDTTDWDCDGDVDDDAVSVDANGDGADQVLQGFDDWSNLVYDGGTVGAFGVHDLNDQNPPLQFSPLQEASYAELREQGLLGAPGDGSLEIVGPYVLLPGSPDQALRVTVRNAGPIAADYVIETESMPGIARTAAIPSVPGHGTGTVDIPVDGDNLVPGTYDPVVTLRGPAGEPLASTTTSVLVPDLADAEIRAQLVQIRNTLASPQPGLDETVRERGVRALTDSLLSEATLSLVTGDAQSTVEGEPFDLPLAVSVVSEGGAALASVPVTFTVADGSAHFDGAAEVLVQSDDEGLASAPPLTGGVAGPVTVVASSGGLTATFALLVTPDETAGAGLEIELEAPGSAARGAEFVVTVRVRNTGTLSVDDIRTNVWIPGSATVVAPEGAVGNGAQYTLHAETLAPARSVTHEFTVTKGSNGNLPLKAATVAQSGDHHIEAWDDIEVARQ